MLPTLTTMPSIRFVNMPIAILLCYFVYDTALLYYYSIFAFQKLYALFELNNYGSFARGVRKLSNPTYVANI